MRNSDKAEARAISNHWREFIHDCSEAVVPITVEGAGLFAVAHALLAVADAITKSAATVARSLDGRSS